MPLPRLDRRALRESLCEARRRLGSSEAQDNNNCASTNNTTNNNNSGEAQDCTVAPPSKAHTAPAVRQREDDGQKRFAPPARRLLRSVRFAPLDQAAPALCEIQEVVEGQVSEECLLAAWLSLKTLARAGPSEELTTLVMQRAPDTLRSADASLRKVACQVLRLVTQHPEYEPPAAEEQALVEQRAAAAAAVALCLCDVNLDVRLAAGLALPGFGARLTAELAATELLPRASSATNSSIDRIQPIKALARAGKAAEVHMAHVLSFLADEAEDVRVAAVASAVDICQASACGALLETLSKDPSAFVRTSVVRALQLCSRGVCQSGHLLKPFTTTEEFTCDCCGQSVQQDLQMHGCRSCDYDLCGACAEPPFRTTASAAIREAALHDADWEVRRAALRALPRIGDRFSAVSALADADADVRFSALEALGQIHDLESEKQVAAVKVVSALLGDSREGPDDVGQADPDSRVRWAAARSLGWTSPQTLEVATAALVGRGLGDEDALVRRWSIWGLSRLSLFTEDEELGERAAKLAQFVTSDCNGDVRKAAILAVGALGVLGHPLVSQVSAGLRDTQPQVREAAVQVLGGMGAVSSLHAEEVAGVLTGDDSRYVRLAAARALGEICSQSPEAVSGACALALAKAMAEDRSLAIGIACVESLAALPGEHGHSQAAALVGLL
ncbi:unnamed protein product, partial [Polarella glacialis]